MATMCLLHGNWHDGSCWEPLARRLEWLGHRALTPDLPLHDPAAGYAERARPAIEALASAEPPVAVVGHSLAAGIAPIVRPARVRRSSSTCVPRLPARSPASMSR
jgi:hypothetical protein